MLVLSRKIGEQISVPCCDVTIEVLRVTKNRVRLGVNAPQKTAVHRSELLERPAVGDESDAEDTDGRDFSSARILVADPEPCLANSYRQFLARRGFQTAVASNALECVTRLRAEVPDILILDPDLPWGGGGGVLALMREDYTVPLVPTLIHAWDRGPATFCDNVFPVVRQVARPLGLSQMEQEVLAMMDRFGPRPPLDASILDTKLVDRLSQWITRRSAGRVRSLHVEAREGRIVVQGLSETYYGRQLVQAAVMEALNILNIGRPDEVEIDITVTTKPR
jgi:carbon storage regulator CsrA